MNIAILLESLSAAAKSVARRRALTAAVILTLTVTIGANAALLTIVDAVIFKPLGFPESGRLVHIQAFWNGGAGNVSYIDYRALLERSRTLEKIAAYESWGVLALAGKDSQSSVVPNFVTPSYFEILGARAVKGRLFVDEDNLPGSDRPIAVLTESLWKNSFAGDPGILDRTILLNGRPHQVVGVVADPFHDLGDVDGPPTDIFLPAERGPSLLSQPPLAQSSSIFWMVAKKKPGTTIAQVRDDISRVARELETELPETHRGYGLRADTLTERVQGRLQTPSLALLAGAFFVLLIGCSNVANLMVIRLTDLRRDMAVRLAIGASSSHLLRQWILEAAVLAAAGGALGIGAAFVTLRSLAGWLRVEVAPFADFSMSGTVLGASTGLVVLAGLLIGVIGWMELRRIGVRDALSRETRSTIGGSDRFRNVMVGAQVAVALSLLTGAGLLLRSFETLATTPLGFDTDRLLTFRMDLLGSEFPDQASRVRFTKNFIDKAKAIPGVSGATLWGPSMLGNATWVAMVAPEGRPLDRADSMTMIFRHNVAPQGLKTLGIPLLAGRDVTDADDLNTPLVGIVSESVARQMWPGDPANAVGKVLVRRPPNGPILVVGVASDAKHRQRYSLADIAEAGVIGGVGPQLDIYVPYAQRRSDSATTFAVRVSDRRLPVLDGLRRAAQSLSSSITISDPMFLDDRLHDQEREPWTLAALMSIYAGVAIFLCTLGVYAVIAHNTARRSREFALRIALGARLVHLTRSVVGPTAAALVAGSVIGMVGALGLSRSLRSLLFGIGPWEPATFLPVLAIFMAAAVLAAARPILRAARIDPAQALRDE